VLKNGELTSKPYEAQGRDDAFLVKWQRWLKLTQIAVDATNFDRDDEERKWLSRNSCWMWSTF
jgi:hypothetical protein